MLVDRLLRPPQGGSAADSYMVRRTVFLAIIIIVGVIVFVLIAFSLWRMLRGDEELEPAGTWGESLKSDEPAPPGTGSPPE
jgi:hypothetical protein